MRWVHLHEENKGRISSYLTELDRVSELLEAAGVSIIVVENSMLARAAQDCPGCFCFGDLDLLITPEKIPVLHKVLTEHGYTAKVIGCTGSTNTPDLSNGRAEYATTLSNADELRVNVQWSLVARRWFAANREPDIYTLFHRSIPIPGSSARMLSPEDNLFQLAVHNSAHAYVRKPGIRLHLDVDRFVRKVDVHWEAFLALVERYHVKTPVYFSLALPKELFDTPIPDYVLECLRPPAWKEQLIASWLQRAGIFNPDERKFSRPGFVLFTALLYDDFAGLWRGVFPDAAWMRTQYGFHSKWLLPYFHGRRLANLAFRRTAT
jgi:hypothetical protein